MHTASRRSDFPHCAIAGCRERKAEYLRDLARHFASGALDPKGWKKLDDETLIAALVEVKGIGRWTAEMFLIFHELRADVLARRRHRPAARAWRCITTAADASRRRPSASSRSSGSPIGASRRGICGVRSTRCPSSTDRAPVDECPAPSLCGPDARPRARRPGKRRPRGDGRLQALGSYENRVYQIGIEDAAPVVAKFYRPGRWSDAAIVEEHAFVAELAAREIPVVAPLALAGGTLHTFGAFRFAVYPRCGGRAPELGNRETLEWMGRFLGRIHAVGALTPFRHRPALDLAHLRHRAARLAARARLHAARSARRLAQHRGAGARRRAPLLRARRRRADRCGCTATATRATCCGSSTARRAARISSTSTTRAWARPCRTCGCCCPAIARR